MSVITLSELSKNYGEKILWKELNLSFEAGQLYALTGPSGCGKSTLLNCIAGLVQPTSGNICIMGTNTGKFSARKWRKLRANTLGFLLQNYALIEDANIEENLKVAAQTSLFSKRPTKTQLSECLTKVELDIALETPISVLSGGERQRVAAARLLLKHKPIILADEPTGALDRENAENILRYLRKMALKGSCVIDATHDKQVRE